MADHFTYRVSWSEEDREYVGSCAEFPSLSHLDATPEAALGGIRALVKDIVADMRKSGEPVPKPIAGQAYSGKFLTRIPPGLHRALAIEAAEAGVSLNRLVSFRLAMPSPLHVAQPAPFAGMAGSAAPGVRKKAAKKRHRSADQTASAAA
ncbi:MAG: type II toxin-antitoxin system HicB family antitoxin [Acetobacteraceae bacterium]